MRAGQLIVLLVAGLALLRCCRAASEPLATQVRRDQAARLLLSATLARLLAL